MAFKPHALPLVVKLVRLLVLVGMIGGTGDRLSHNRWYESAAGLGGIAALILAWRFLFWLCPGKFCTVLDLSVSLLVGQGIVWGTIYHGYDQYSFYDTLTHLLFGMVLAWAGILLLFRKMKSQQQDLGFEAGLVLLFGLSFSMLGKVIWEFYEFAGDRFVAADMQRWQEGDLVALTDTMADLSAGLLGAMLVSLPVYWIMRRYPERFNRKWIQPHFRC